MVIVAVYVMFEARLFNGVKIAVLSTQVTVPGTLFPLDVSLTVKDAAVIVEGFMLWLKIALIFLLMATPVTLFAGSVKVTVGMSAKGSPPTGTMPLD